MALLEIENLSVSFATRRGTFKAVDGVSLTMQEGDSIGIVGESGSGKSVSMLAMMGLIAKPGKVTADKLVFDGHDLLKLSDKERRRIVGKDMAMIFQEPMTSLNPCYTGGYQIMETLRVHEGGSRRQLRDRAIELMEQVGIPDAPARLNSYPHQLSGGMSQRVMIAMAIACNPKLLIADEPTTALDVTIQAQILDLLRDLQKNRGTGLIMITHDMAVVAETAERTFVMYSGQVVENRNTDELLSKPRHPYTAALLSALPERAVAGDQLATIPGVVPGIDDRPVGCMFNPRCSHVSDQCREARPVLEPDSSGAARCFTPLSGEQAA